MKQYVLILICMLFGLTASAQAPCKDELCVVQYNANWNAGKSVDWLSKLTDCKVKEIDIATDTEAAGKYKIVVVPTIVIYNNGEEVKRFQANIMMEMEATKKDVQSAIDDIIMEGF